MLRVELKYVLRLGPSTKLAEAKNTARKLLKTVVLINLALVSNISIFYLLVISLKDIQKAHGITLPYV